ncbi:MAG: hypothetical protein JOY80_07400, partial [Candidatus Dormibacteraeota bacterium]|nr:hypothetical protein [Candidatus Dormibacteraeota bacterium]
MRTIRVVVTSLVLLAPAVPVLSPILAHAATCGSAGTYAADPNAYPNDPGYSPAERGYTNPTQTNTWDGEDWYLYNCVPQDIGNSPSQTPPGTGTASDPDGMSGIGADALWNRNPNPQRGDGVLVAYMEGGVNWRIGQSCELKDRSALNTANLPYPENAQGLTKPQLEAMGVPFSNGDPYDLNNDGIVNVEDYLNDPRVIEADKSEPKSPAGGPFLHHVCAGAGVANTAGYAPTDITPEDLIVAFGHCEIQNGAIVNGFIDGSSIQQCPST